MASVPSIGCLLARNQYYRKSSISSVSSLMGSDSVNFIDDDKSQQGLPEVAESTWWFKSFFHSEPVLSNVRVKDLSALGADEHFVAEHLRTAMMNVLVTVACPIQHQHLILTIKILCLLQTSIRERLPFSAQATIGLFSIVRRQKCARDLIYETRS
ncbi:hypothetical protein P7K49_026205 [Saguinus oedipus]|uniref:Pancreatic progenitor cell differentiation and proliferation factor-like protein n=1 Tax=Saguinus oedipus TaxID=9490 RepID=A0ABQ9UCJ9_SAGOE|nr:hypothetical protein P7K49_026205 [Saguinus oedipus]